MSFSAPSGQPTGGPIVEPAHMQFAEPFIGTAFDACVAAGALTVVIAPFFLGPGNDCEHDIPALAAAAARFRDVRYLVTGPLGRHSLLADLVEDRVQ